jgi:hypothetical protein
MGLSDLGDILKKYLRNYVVFLMFVFSGRPPPSAILQDLSQVFLFSLGNLIVGISVLRIVLSGSMADPKFPIAVLVIFAFSWAALALINCKVLQIFGVRHRLIRMTALCASVMSAAHAFAGMVVLVIYFCRGTFLPRLTSVLNNELHRLKDLNLIRSDLNLPDFNGPDVLNQLSGKTFILASILAVAVILPRVVGFRHRLGHGSNATVTFVSTLGWLIVNWSLIFGALPAGSP